MFIKASHSRSFLSEKLILIEFVCHYSPVLDAAFNSGFVEGRTQTYELDDTRPGAFRFFVQWLYGQDIDLVGPYTESFDAKNVVLTSSDTDGEGQGRESGTGDEAMREGGAEAGEGVGEEEDDEDDTNEADDDNYGVTAYWSDEHRKFGFQDPVYLDQDLNLVHLWVLADKLLLPRLQNTAMRALRKMDQYYWSTHWIQYAWRHTAPRSPLRYLAIDLCSYVVPAPWQKSHPQDFPHSMLLELSSNLLLEPLEGNKYLHCRVGRDYLVDEGDMVEDV